MASSYTVIVYRVSDLFLCSFNLSDTKLVQPCSVTSRLRASEERDIYFHVCDTCSIIKYAIHFDTIKGIIFENLINELKLILLIQDKINFKYDKGEDTRNETNFN